MDLLNLAIKIFAQDEASDTIDDVSERSIGKLIDAAKKAAEALASMWAVKKVFDFGKAAFDAYSEFEQLAGGAEKIFDEMDQSKVLEDANGAWKNLNMSANEYLASINQTGAMFAQTMGDEKGYETAKAGMQAISDYATGTGKDINGLNDKFSAITRSTGSYQSIADQFAGILPATSKDFLEQAKAAGFLSDSYEELTDVPVAEYQEAVTKMLEKGVEDLGLANNTAKEALGTLSGSMLATKSAWQNLVTEFGKPDADIGARISDMMTAVLGENGEGGLLRNVTKEVGVIARNMIGAIADGIGSGVGWLLDNGPELMATALRELGDAIERGWYEIMDFENGGLAEAILGGWEGSGIAEKVSGFVQGIGDAITEWWPYVTDQLGYAWEEIVLVLQNNGPQILSALGTVLGNIGNWILQNGPTIIGKVAEVWYSLIEWVTSHGPEIVNKVGEIVTNVVTVAWQWLLANGPKILAAAMEAFSNIWKAIKEHGPTILGNIAETIGAVVGFIASSSTKLLTAAVEFMGGLITGTSEEGEKLHQWFSELPDRLLAALGDVGSFLWDAGTQIIEGFWNGLKDKWSEVTGWVSGIGSWIADNKGPKQYDLGLLVDNGKWIMQSLQTGLEKGLPPVEDTLRDITDSIQTGINTNVSVARAPRQTDTALMGMLGAIRDNMSMKVYLDSGRLVGGIAPQMNVAMGRL